MNDRQAALMLVLAVLGVLSPWFSVGMFFMGAAIGGYFITLLSDD